MKPQALFLRAVTVLSLLAALAVQAGCTSTCDVVGNWQNTSSPSCTSCGSSSCSGQGANFLAGALNASICTATMNGCYTDCRRNNPSHSTNGPGNLDCICAYQCYSGECRDRFEAYTSCLISNCTNQCR